MARSNNSSRVEAWRISWAHRNCSFNLRIINYDKWYYGQARRDSHNLQCQWQSQSKACLQGRIRKFTILRFVWRQRMAALLHLVSWLLMITIIIAGFMGIAALFDIARRGYEERALTTIYKLTWSQSVDALWSLRCGHWLYRRRGW